MLVLLVTDDGSMASVLSAWLRHAEFGILRAATGTSAEHLLHQRPDAVILDLDLAGDQGLRVCRRLRAASDVPIIATTARPGSTARVHCLNVGADDCVTRPFDFSEIVARIRAVARRRGPARPAGLVPAATPASTPGKPAAVVGTGRVSIDVAERVATVDGRRVRLTAKEAGVLTTLVRRPGLVMRHEEITAEVWNTDSPDTRRTLQVHIAALRQKLQVPALIESVHGVGYRLATAVG
jgi:DNA-binding response OmpR family regulator